MSSPTQFLITLTLTLFQKLWTSQLFGSQVSEARRLRPLRSWHASFWALRQIHLASEPSCSLGLFRMKYSHRMRTDEDVSKTCRPQWPQQGVCQIWKSISILHLFLCACILSGYEHSTIVQPKTLQKPPSHHPNNNLFRQGRSDSNLLFAQLVALLALPDRLVIRASHIESTLGDQNVTGTVTDKLLTRTWTHVTICWFSFHCMIYLCYSVLVQSEMDLNLNLNQGKIRIPSCRSASRQGHRQARPCYHWTLKTAQEYGLWVWNRIWVVYSVYLHC